MFVTLATVLAVLAIPPLQAWRLRPRPVIDEQQFLVAVHGELRAGSSLRYAIASAARAQPGDIARNIHCAAAGYEPLAAVCGALRQLPQTGRAAAMATRVASESGGRAADVFLGLADQARVNADLQRQRRTLTAQARVSAAVVASLPVLWLVVGGWDRLQVLVSHGGGIVAAVGIGMEVLGISLVWRMAAT